MAITDDAFTEGTERYEIEISNPGSASDALILVGPSSVVETTINDTQGIGGQLDGPVEWMITGTTSSDEGTSATYTISLSGTLGENEVVTVDLELADITTNPSDHGQLVDAITGAVSGQPYLSFDSNTGTLTYTAPSDGASMDDLVVSLPITDDALIEGTEDFQITLSNATTSTDASVAISATHDSVTTVINDTQGPAGPIDGPAQWSITGSDIVDEGAFAQYTVQLTGVFGDNESVSVDIDLDDLTTNPTDYGNFVAAIALAANSDANISFDTNTLTLTYTSPDTGGVAEGGSMNDLAISLPITDDNLIEGTEQFTIELSNATTSTDASVTIDSAASDVTTTINDTQGNGGPLDGPGVWSIVGPSSADEGSEASYTVSLTGAFGESETASVAIQLSDIDTNTNDYANIISAIQTAANDDPSVSFNAITSTLTFTSPSEGATMSPLTIDLALTDDTLIEGAEQFSMTLSDPGSTTDAAVIVNPFAGDVVTTINDTQGINGPLDGPAQWSITGTTEQNEGGFATYNIDLDGNYQAGETISVQIDVTDISTTPGDYENVHDAIKAAADLDPSVQYDVNTQTLTFTAPFDGASMSGLNVSVEITEDNLAEPNEQFAIQLSAPGSATGVDVSIDPTSDQITTLIRSAPIANPDTAVFDEDTVTSGNVTNNDLDLDGDPLTVTQVTMDINGDSLPDLLPLGVPTSVSDIAGNPIGTLTVNPDGTYVFAPATDYDGDVPIVTYTVTDGHMTDSTTLDLVITPVNDAPDANDDEVPVAEDTPVTGNVLDNDVDVDGDPLTVQSATVDIDADGLPDTLPLGTPTTLTNNNGDAIGELTLQPGGTFTFNPAPDYFGPVPVVTYTITDPGGLMDTATLTFGPVTPVNDAPHIVPGNELVDLNADDSTVITPIDVSDTFDDVESDVLTFNAIGLPPGLTIDPTSGIITGTIDSSASQGGPDSDGVYTVTVSADDGNGGFTETTFIYSVANPLPVAQDDPAGTDEDTATSGDAFADNGNGVDSDPDGDAILITAVDGNPAGVGNPVSGTEGGLFTINPDGTYAFDPNGEFDDLQEGESRTTEITYTLSDVDGGTDTATITVEVQGVYDPPVAIDDFRQTPLETPITVSVVDNDRNPEQNPLDVIVLSSDPGGEVITNSDGTITFEPDTEFIGTVNIEYLIEDPLGSTSRATLTIRVVSPYTWDSFNNFAQGFGPHAPAGQNPAPTLLSKDIFSLAPDPIFSGYARPGTEIVGRIYDESGRLVGERYTNADPGGNWMMQFQGISKFNQYRIEFDYVASSADVYGYLGLNPSDNSYQAMQPLTGWDEPLNVSGAMRNAPHDALTQMHNEHNRPQGFGT